MEENRRRGCPTKTTAEVPRFMEAEIEKVNEITSVELQRILARRYGVQGSLLLYEGTYAKH